MNAGRQGRSGTVVGKCRAVQMAEDVLPARTQPLCAAQRRQSAPQHRALPSSVDLCLCWLPLLRPTSSSCIDDGRATTLPLLLSVLRAPSRWPFMHAQLHHPSCATGDCERKPSRPDTRNAALSWPTGQPCARRCEGKRAGGSLTVRLTREWAYSARDGVA
jgi:hypothetical protein